MLRKLAVVLLVALVIVVLIATNPTEQRHKEVLSQKWGQELAGNNWAGVLVEKLIRAAGDWGLMDAKYQSYLVFSTLAVEGKVVSFGLLGQVIVKRP